MEMPQASSTKKLRVTHRYCVNGQFQQNTQERYYYCDLIWHHSHGLYVELKNDNPDRSKPDLLVAIIPINDRFVSLSVETIQ
jgi:hypothetical protein